MENKKRKTIRFRLQSLATIYTLLVAACGVVGMLAIRYLGGSLQSAGVQSNTFLFILIFIALIAIAVVLLVFAIHILTARVQQPFVTLGNMANHLAGTGNLKMPDHMLEELAKYKNVSDDVGSVIISFEKLVETLLEKVAVLEAVAQGDLRNKVTPISDEDYLGIAVDAVVSNLNTIVRDVITATEQLSIGANELSMGAQSLSQSSSEQSATMDRLHVTAGEIAAEAAENAERAAEASVLTAQIRVNATEGGRKMLDMTTAMNEINKSSHSIGSVMKAIDDIAFQTNILALNAAVEAARAGIHGKGFAVVADEVRNLATKSGEAASDSNAMIADTIAKSDMGTRIVDEAIAFFKTIEEGIANINELLDEIAKATKSQSFAIEQVNKSLTDMTNVVYHNSATSQESAAASEQMSSQAIVLKETVNRFLLADDPSSGFRPAIEAKPEQDYNFVKPEQTLDFSKPAFEFDFSNPEKDYQVFSAPLYESDTPAFNPTTAPSEDGGLSPAELYAEALERETHGGQPAPAVTPGSLSTLKPVAPPIMTRQDPDAESGFTDDDSKY